jgi:predicted phosphodiesterase
VRYLVFGDVHGNLPALDAVLAAAGRLAVEGYLCVGDLIGYGPEPLECLGRVRALAEQGRLAWVAGNHELVVRDEIALEDCNAEAQCTLTWTRGLLQAEPETMAFVASAHNMVQVQKGIWLTHDSLVQPSSGQYHRWPQNAKLELEWLASRRGVVAFYGHTHTMRAELSRASGDVVLAPMTPVTDDARDMNPIRVPAGERAWIGTGSVGLPRNTERLAEFLVLDDGDWSVEKYAVEYSRQQARARVREVIGAACGRDVAERIARWL